MSHAHSDHTNRHGKILATPATLALARERASVRSKPLKPSRTRREPEEMALEFGEPLEIDGATVKLFPAGHVLGSAQILVERDGVRLLYSGDFCPEKTAAAEEIQIPRADILIMECTYGLPEHKFPPRDKVLSQLRAFVDSAFKRGQTPVCLCYALGKGQEVVRILGKEGYQVAVEAETWRLAQVYRKFGVKFPHARVLDSRVLPGEVVVTPSLERVERHIESEDYRTAAVTGWAAGGFSYRAARADTRIPLSDHADFQGLMDYVKAVSPEVVYIHHGPEEFGYYLKKAGFKAAPVKNHAPLFG